MMSPFSDYEKRIFLCCGLTRDRFCLPDLTRVGFDEFLYAHFRELGYEHIAFYSHRGLYFFDDTASAGVMGGAAASQKPELAQAPGGLRLRPDSPAPLQKSSPVRRRFPNMPFAEFITILEQVMRAEQPRTAVVFYTDHLEGFADKPAVVQQFKGMLEADFRGLPPVNRNLIVFVFGINLEDLSGYLREKPWNFLFGLHPDGRGRGIAHVVHIGPPEPDEVKRLVHHYRLTRGLEVEWPWFPAMVHTLAAVLKSEGSPLARLEKWLEETADTSGPALTREHVRVFSGKSVEEKSARQRLDDLVGLSHIKEMIDQQMRLHQTFIKHHRGDVSDAFSHHVSINRLNMARGRGPFLPRFNLHLALKGNPGTGKTTAAGLLGEIYREAGILELGHTVKVTRKDLVAGYVGQTALKTREKIEQALGGILFIDEAYSLVQGGDNDFGREAITEILEAMSALKGQFAVVAAGYPDEIEALINANPGFKRRFDAVLEIPDFTPALLETVFRNTCREFVPRVNLAPSLDAALPAFFENLYQNRGKNFGNAGTVKDEIFMGAVKKTIPDESGVLTLCCADFPESYIHYFEHHCS